MGTTFHDPVQQSETLLLIYPWIDIILKMSVVEWNADTIQSQ